MNPKPWVTDNDNNNNNDNDGDDDNSKNDNDNNNPTTGDAQQLHNVKKPIICLLFFNTPHAAEMAQQHTNPWSIDMIFMD
jgi:hypothetical protein